MTKLSAYNKLKDYFHDRYSERDEAEIIKWFVENPDSEEVDDILESILDEVSVEDPAMAQEAFENFCRHIGHTQQHIHTQKHRLSGVLKWTQRIAAILAIPLAAALSIMFLHTKPNSVPEWEERIVPMGQRSELLLSDGTLLRLNSGTRVTYPVNFNGDQRKVFVDGEVYAEVARDESRPFIISAGDVQVEVLGTTFNMRAYGTDSSVELALVEGSVRFDVDSDKCDEQVVMVRNDIVQYDRQTGDLDVSTFQSMDYRPRAVGGGFYFFKESLEDISAQLSRSFDRRIVITDYELAGEEFYALFTNNESLLDILATLNADGSMAVNEKNGVIYISPRKR